jgi:hypothetical protein
VAVDRPNPPIFDFVPAFARSLNQMYEIGFAQIGPLWSLLPESGQDAFDRSPSFVVEFKFVEPGFMTKGMGQNPAQGRQIFHH